jgi:hypothetical protein
VPVIDDELREAMQRLDKTLQERKTKNPFPVLKKPDLVDQLEVLRNAFGPVKKLPESEVHQEQDILDKISQQIRLQVLIDSIKFQLVKYKLFIASKKPFIIKNPVPY